MHASARIAGSEEEEASHHDDGDDDFVAESEDDDFQPETKSKAAKKSKAKPTTTSSRKRKATAAQPKPKGTAAKRPFFGAAAVAKRDDNAVGGAQSSDAAAAASCPVCGKSFALSAVNAHLDACLSRGGTGGGAAAAHGGSAAPARAAALPPVAPAARTPPPSRAAVFAPSPLQRGGGADHAAASPAAATPGGTTCDAAALHVPLRAGEPLTWPAAALAFRVAGRRFHRQAAACAAGARATLRREPENAADCNAILVVAAATAADDVSAAPLGHVPAAIAAHLAPLLDRGWLRVQCALPDGAVASAAAPSADAPAAVAHGFAAADLPPRAAAALRAGWAAAHAAADAAAGAGGRAAAQRRSFRLVVQTVLRRDAPLFPRRHAAMLAAAAALDDAACTLLLQMHSRKGPWFRADALHYADVPDIDAALDALCAAGMARAMPAAAAAGGVAGNDGGELDDSDESSSGDDASDDEDSDRRSRFEVLTAVELRAAASAAGASVSGGARRSDSLAALLRAPAARAEAAWAAAARLGARLRAGACAALRRAFLLFFLVPDADASRFLLVDLGAISYPRTALRDADRDDVACRVFPSRAALNAYEAALRRRDALAAAAEAGNAAATAEHAAAAAAALGIDAAALRSLADNGAEAIDVDDGGDTAEHAADSASSAAIPPQFARFSAAHVLAGCCSEGVAVLERARRYADAVALLRSLLALGDDTEAATAPTPDAAPGREAMPHRPRPGLRGGWWLRLCTDLEHLGRTNCALSAAESGLADPACGPADVAALQAKVLRLAVPPRRWKPPPWAAEAAAAAAAHAPRLLRLPAPPALRSVTGRKSLFAAPHAAHGDDVAAEGLHAALPADATSPAAAAAAAALAAADADAGAPAVGAAAADVPPAPDAITVEALALAHYAAQGWQGSHCESGIWLTMFTLLFWPIIFDATGAHGAPRGVFQSAFQTAPLDFGTRGFAESRREALAARLARIAAGDGPRLLAATWALHRGAAAAGVNWRAHSLAELQAVAEGVRPAPLAALMRLLATDYAGWRAGLPDLVLWRGAPGSPSCQTMLVEVKGPRDAMRPGQRAWAIALGAAGVRMEILQYE